MYRVFVMIVTAIVLLSGCASVPTKDIQIETQADPKANMVGYQTYSWLGSAAILSDAYGQWEPPAFDADTEIKFLIDRELRKRGWSESAVNPDMIVAFAAGIDMDSLDVKVDPDGDISALNVPRGGLAVLLVDSESGFVVWLGIATGEVQNQPDTEVARARLDYAVTKLLKQLPE